MNAEAKFVSSVMDARLKKAKRERDAYKKQRDELINDMQNVKRKAEAFDEIKHIINEKDVYDETLVLKVEDVVFYCETDISRGSSDE
ncbi:hypothetical protein [Staphylococcus hominis]|uniref:hypothetical protein n=1 Tax=Staphylococcus hominis TaxID=1290 RepID=UPI0011A3F9A1|nr:hypothetical protein [Staphylococcus hominis]